MENRETMLGNSSDKPINPVNESQRKATVIYILFLAGYLVPILPIVAFIMAIVQRPTTAGTVYYNHLTYLIRTFIITLIGMIISFVTMFILIGILLLFVVSIWNIFRLVYGFVKFQNNEDINPKKWFAA